ncbi:hypothetical protein GE09DRAFT_1195236 [Coniochaeta sp. 2T2.1]|nr:hypothetical protein GE09DRAFT_1195236 [Coniochaeta sp. 2T2.1]
MCILLILKRAFARHITGLERPVDTTDTIYCGGLEEPTIFTYGDVDDGGPGIILQDNDNNLEQPHYYFLYENSRDTHPWKYTLVHPHLPLTFRFLLPLTLPEANPRHPNLPLPLPNLPRPPRPGAPSTNGWADISLLQGCDGAATVAALDGSGVSTGFTGDLLTGAPAAVLRGKDDGSLAIAKTVGERASDAAREYELSLLDPMRDASIVEEYKPAIGSGNGRFVVVTQAIHSAYAVIPMRWNEEHCKGSALGNIIGCS